MSNQWKNEGKCLKSGLKQGKFLKSGLKAGQTLKIRAKQGKMAQAGQNQGKTGRPAYAGQVVAQVIASLTYGIISRGSNPGADIVLHDRF